MLETDLRDCDSWVLSGSLCGWGDSMMARFTLAVVTELDVTIRMQRLTTRERSRYGDAIRPGGDRHERHLEFLDWARSYDTAAPPTRSRRLHDAWLSHLDCPVVRVNTERPIAELVADVLRSIVTDV